MVSAILIPKAIKNYSLPLTNLNYWQYTVPIVSFLALHSAFITHTGLTITKLQEIFHPKKFSEKSEREKMELYVEWLVMFVSGFLMVVMAGRLLHRLKHSKCLEMNQKRKIELEKITQVDDYESGEDSFETSETFEI